MTKSAGNCHLFCESQKRSHTSASETTREKSFLFAPFYSVFPNSNPGTISDTWLEWFIGFAEGDGAILTSKEQLRFVLTQKEGDVLYHIQNMFGFGLVRYFPQGSSNKNGFYRWIVTDSKQIVILAHLFNGNLAIEHRVLQLQKWINLLNQKTNSIIPITKIRPITLSDAWLSGFTDAEGCFNVNITKNTRYNSGYVVQLRYMLDQKDSNILSSIQSLFGFGSVVLRSSTNGVYRYQSTGFERMKEIRQYFTQFPLRTLKSSSLEKWSRVHDMVLYKEHLTKEGLQEIKKIQKTINLQNSNNQKTGAASPSSI